MGKINRVISSGRTHVRTDCSYLKLVGIGVITFALYFIGISEASVSMDYNLTGSSSKSKGVTKESSSFSQNYSLNYSKPIALTKTINISGDISAAKSISQDQKRRETSSVSPSLSFGINNPYFNFSSTYNTNKFPGISTDDSYSNDTWSSSFSTAPEGYPDLRFGITKSATKSISTVSPQNSTSTNIMAGTGYKFNNINTMYNYTFSQSRDNVSQMESRSPAHFAKIGYSNSMFNNRVGFTVDYSRSNSVSETEALSAEGGFEDTLKSIEKGLFKDDDSAVIGELDIEEELTDADKSTAIKDQSSNVVDLNLANRNIGFKLQEAARIHTIYLNLTFDIDKIDEDELEKFDYGWKVYTSSDGTNWVLFTPDGIAYDIDNNRFKFTLKSEQFKESAPEAFYFKVVNTIKSNILLPDIKITEIEAVGTTTKDRFTTHKSEFDRQFLSGSVNFNLSEKITLGYNLSFDTSESSSKSDAASETGEVDETKNFSNSVSLSYMHSRYLSFASSAMSQQRENSGSKKTGSNNISVSVSSTPIDAINGSFSLNRSENLTDGEMDSNTNSANLNMFLKLYTGADLGLGVAFNNTESKEGQNENSQSANANLTMAPWSAFSMQLFGSKFYKTTYNPDGMRDVSPATTSLRLILNYNPSRFISISTNIQIEPVVERNFSVSSRLPGSLQISLNYSRSNSDAESYGVSASWNVSKFIYFSTNYGFSVANNPEGDRSDTYSIRASLRF